MVPVTGTNFLANFVICNCFKIVIPCYDKNSKNNNMGVGCRLILSFIEIEKNKFSQVSIFKIGTQDFKVPFVICSQLFNCRRSTRIRPIFDKNTIITVAAFY